MDTLNIIITGVMACAFGCYLLLSERPVKLGWAYWESIHFHAISIGVLRFLIKGMSVSSLAASVLIFLKLVPAQTGNLSVALDVFKGILLVVIIGLLMIMSFVFFKGMIVGLYNTVKMRLRGRP